MHWSYRTNAVSLGLLSLAGCALSAGYLPGDAGWAIAGLGGSLVYAVLAVVLWRGASWASAVGVGLTGFSLGLWVQSSLALAVFAPSSAATDTSLLTCAGGVIASAAALGLLLTIPRSVSLRHAASTALAGAALVPAVIFALAPSQSPAVALAMGAGSVSLVAGTVAVGRGRTWGLLLNLLGASVMAIGVMFAPWLGTVTAVNPWIPNATGFLVTVLGSTAAGLALLSTTLYAVPLVRFLVRRS